MEHSTCFPTIIKDNLLQRLSSNEIDFDVFKERILLDSNIIRTYAQVLHQCQSGADIKFQITSKDLLMTYLFAFYDFSDEMKPVSNEVITYLHNCNKNDFQIKILAQKISKYQDLYIEWKKKDVMIVLQEMTQLFWEFELICELNKSTFTVEEMEHYISDKKCKQEILLNRMKEIDNLQYFYSYQPVVMSDDIVFIVHETLKRAYWDKIKSGLPNIDGILEVLTDIRNKIMYLQPRNGSSMITHFDEVLDIDYIKQLHELGATTVDYWVQKCHHLKQFLEDLDSPVRVAQHNTIWQVAEHEIEKEVEHVSKLHLCIDFFAYITSRLHELEKLKKDFQDNIN